jgi:protocadherin alpha
MITGQFCECDNFSCDRHNSILCSGPDHGVCDCGTCKCHEGWEGPACECSSSVDTCRAPNGEICSGHGTCRCGRCECDIKEDVRYSGKYCEKCPTCPERCEELKACVECQQYKKGPLKDPEDCARNCTLFVPVAVEQVECEYFERCPEILNYKFDLIIAVDDEKDEHFCQFYDEDECRYKFVYNETVEKNGTVTLHVSKILRVPKRYLALS